MAWDDKILSDLNALLQNSASDPEPEPSKQKPLDLSAIEAQITASISSNGKPEPAAEPVPEPASVRMPPEEPALPGEIVLEPIRVEDSANVATPPAPAPEPTPTPQNLPDFSAIEAQIMASISSDSKPEPAAEPAPETPEPVAQDPAPEVPDPVVQESAPEDDESVPAPSESAPEREPEPHVYTRDDVIHMAFSHAPTDLSHEETKKIFRKTAADLVPGYLGGMRIEDAVLRCDRTVMEHQLTQADTDTLLVFLKFLCIEVTTARNEALVSELETFVTGLLLRRLNSN